MAGAQMGQVSLQAEGEGITEGGQSTHRAEAEDATRGGGSQSSRGCEGCEATRQGPQRLGGQWVPRCRLGVHEGVWGERFQEDPVMSPSCRPGILECDHPVHAQRSDS